MPCSPHVQVVVDEDSAPSAIELASSRAAVYVRSTCMEFEASRLGMISQPPGVSGLTAWQRLEREQHWSLPAGSREGSRQQAALSFLTHGCKHGP